MERYSTQMADETSDTSDTNWNAFLSASRSFCQRGDYEQAERLLTSGLKRAEEQIQFVEGAVEEILVDLIELYDAQGKTEEAERLRRRMAALARSH
jgi:uncharacterized protein HemY